jgi:hypothetical protein
MNGFISRPHLFSPGTRIKLKSAIKEHENTHYYFTSIGEKLSENKSNLSSNYKFIRRSHKIKLKTGGKKSPVYLALLSGIGCICIVRESYTSNDESISYYLLVLRIRIRMFLGHPDPHPDPLVRGTAIRLRILSSKNSNNLRKTLIPTVL